MSKGSPNGYWVYKVYMTSGAWCQFPVESTEITVTPLGKIRFLDKDKRVKGEVEHDKWDYWITTWQESEKKGK